MGCQSALSRKASTKLAGGMQGKLMAGCCVLQPEVLTGSWRPSCASVNESEPTSSLAGTSPYVVLSIAMCQSSSHAAKCVYNSPKVWRLWVGTLRKVYAGDVIVFVGAATTPWVVRYVQQQKIALSTKRDVKNIVLERMLWFAAACRPYRWCLAVDFRDAYFQRDPLARGSMEAAAHGAHVVVQQENALTIATEPYTRAWIQHCFGSAALQRLGAERPVCGGSIVATPLGMRSLKDAFCGLLWRRVGEQNRVCNDQGILNYLAYADDAAHGGVPWLVQRHGSGNATLVNHIGTIYPRHKVSAYRDAAGFVLDDDGARSAVVHQHNRFPPLVRFAQSLAG